MQQMERQKENQEQLLAELDRRKVQLAESETASQAESTEPVLESEDREGKHEESSLGVLLKDSYALQETNSQLLKILLEVVKTAVAVEETIGRHVVGLLDLPSKYLKQ